MSGPMVEERQIRLILDESGELSLEQPELDQALGDGTHRGLVRLVPVVAGTHLVDGGELRLEHDLVDARCAGVNRPLTGKVRVMSEA
jgi:hypothetical protein